MGCHEPVIPHWPAMRITLLTAQLSLEEVREVAEDHSFVLAFGPRRGNRTRRFSRQRTQMFGGDTTLAADFDQPSQHVDRRPVCAARLRQFVEKELHGDNLSKTCPNVVRPEHYL